MSDLRNILQTALRLALGTRCSSKVTLAINAGSAATVKTTGAAIILIDGIFYSVAALSAQSIAITHGLLGNTVAQLPAAYVQPALTTVYYVVGLNAAGTVCVVQGSYSGQAIAAVPNVSPEMTATGALPVMPAGYAAIGVIKIATAAATTFTPATTALDAAGITATYFDVSMLPTATL